MPTGWRPADREQEAPIEFTRKAKDQVKYDTEGSLPMHLWMWFQLLFHIVLMLYMFNVMADFFI